MNTLLLATPQAMRRRHMAGLSIVELLVSVTIGGILIFGATQIYVDSRNTYQVNESIVRLQENARFALSVLEPDIRNANYWGLSKGGDMVEGQARQSATSLGIAASCGENYAHDLMTNIESSNNSYALDCSAFGATGAAEAADTLTVRRVSAAAATADDDFIQICSTRQRAWIAASGESCPDIDGLLTNLSVNTYYISQDSSQGIGIPSLRRKFLGSGPEFADAEILPGVEDMQVQFGIETVAAGGQPTGTVERYVNQVTPEMHQDGTQIISVRVWLLLRADSEEQGFVNDSVYEYGDRSADNDTTDNIFAASSQTFAYAPNDRVRRLLVSRTINLRNFYGN